MLMALAFPMVGKFRNCKKGGMRMTDADTVWNSLETAKFAVSAVTPAVIIWIGYIINRKLDELKTTSEWRKLWATKFLKCSSDYSDSLSGLVAGIQMYALRYNGGKDAGNDQAVLELRKKESCIDRMILNKWDIENYAQFAENNKDNIIAAAEELWSLSRALIDYCKKQDGTHFDLEETRKAQFEYNKAARQVHSELLGIKE